MLVETTPKITTEEAEGGRELGNARVVDIKLDIRVDKLGLDRGQVDANDVAVRELIAHLYGPAASASGNVEHPMGRVLLRERCQIISLVKHDLDDVVLDI